MEMPCLVHRFPLGLAAAWPAALRAATGFRCRQLDSMAALELSVVSRKLWRSGPCGCRLLGLRGGWCLCGLRQLHGVLVGLELLLVRHVVEQIRALHEELGGHVHPAV